jgi:hypothetical protein
MSVLWSMEQAEPISMCQFQQFASCLGLFVAPQLGVDTILASC